jgi:signal recognition particle GTPase
MADDKYGLYFRSSFKDTRGTSELGMLASPSKDELEQLKRAVAIMTPAEKQKVESLTDEQVHRIAADAGVDAGILAIFINGYALELKRVSQVHGTRGEN